MNKIGVAMLSTTVFAVSGWTQVNSGTIVLVGISKDRVLIAADSRGTSGKGVFRDDVCKIAVLGNRLIFAAFGLIADSSNKLPEFDSFDAFEEAKTTFDSAGQLPAEVLQKKGETFTSEVAEEWRQRLGMTFSSAARTRLDDWLRGLGDGRNSVPFWWSFFRN